MPVFTLLAVLLMLAIATANMAAPAFPETRFQRFPRFDHDTPDH